MTKIKGLQKLGVSEYDVKIAERLLSQIPSCSDPDSKEEQVLGYTLTRLCREKAIKVLGTTETEIELENAKNLGSLGVGGRRRSWQATSELDFRKSEYCPYPRRRHSTKPIEGVYRRKKNLIEARSFGQPLQSQFNVSMF